MPEKKRARVPDNNGKTYKRTVEDPRVAIFKQFYINPNSHTFMNIFQSALRAGYTEYYAKNISHRNPKWWQELINDSDVRRARMLQKSEQHFESVLDKSSEDTDKETVKLKQRTAEFVAERVGKDVYSTRKELTDKGGRRLFTNESKERSNESLQELFVGVQADPRAK